MVDKVVRCPYCVQSDLNAFVAMIAQVDGRHVCALCGHVAVPKNEDFRCSCGHCLAKEAFD